MEPLVQRSVNYLKSYYPSDLAIWMNMEYMGPPSFEVYHAIGVVNLAWLTGEYVLLPTALMACCTLTDAIPHGFQREDDTIETLCPDDINRCFVAKDKLMHAGIRMALSILSPTAHRRCTSAVDCRQVLRKNVCNLDRTVEKIAKVHPFDTSIWDYYDTNERLGKLCDACFRMIKHRLRDERELIWAKLPSFFGLEVPGWPQTGDSDTQSEPDQEGNGAS